MNSEKVIDIINIYKQKFNSISKNEIYKWRAVKHFQVNWDINASDFSRMLENSFKLTKNLLDSGNYYPRKMLFESAKIEPENVRQLFINLYNEEESLIDRIANFKQGIRNIINKSFHDKKDFQDDRAVLVYLCLRYPNIYYLYKFSMLKDFSILVDYPFQPQKGKIQNILEYLSLCDIINAEIIKDNELTELHKTRIGKQEYYDGSFHILTQDIIYAATKYIEKIKINKKQESAFERLVKVNNTILVKPQKVILKGSFTNHIENNKKKARIGALGELLVLQYEQERLKSIGVNKEPEHKSKSEGDGLGYDILSYDEKGKEIFIEVKTTSNGANTPFYITKNELQKSKDTKDRYFLYRLYDFDESNNKALYYEYKGDLTKLCIDPILYEVKI